MYFSIFNMYLSIYVHKWMDLMLIQNYFSRVIFIYILCVCERLTGCDVETMD